MATDDLLGPPNARTVASIEVYCHGDEYHGQALVWRPDLLEQATSQLVAFCKRLVLDGPGSVSCPPASDLVAVVHLEGYGQRCGLAVQLRDPELHLDGVVAALDMVRDTWVQYLGGDTPSS